MHWGAGDRAVIQHFHHIAHHAAGSSLTMAGACVWFRRTLSGLAAIMVILALGSCGHVHFYLTNGRTNQRLHTFRSGQCRSGDPLDGVYLPFRLHVKRSCVTVGGTVDCVRREPDGDVHIEVRLRRAYRHLLTPANAYQRCPGHSGPHLVVEIIPQGGELPFPDNSATRAGFVTPKAPKPGQHIKVTGPYVWDTNALHDLIYPGKNVANWAEIHPAWNVTVTRRASWPSSRSVR